MFRVESLLPYVVACAKGLGIQGCLRPSAALASAEEFVLGLRSSCWFDFPAHPNPHPDKECPKNNPEIKIVRRVSELQT